MDYWKILVFNLLFIQFTTEKNANSIPQHNWTHLHQHNLSSPPYDKKCHIWTLRWPAAWQDSAVLTEFRNQQSGIMELQLWFPKSGESPLLFQAWLRAFSVGWGTGLCPCLPEYWMSSRVPLPYRPQSLIHRRINGNVMNVVYHSNMQTWNDSICYCYVSLCEVLVAVYD